MNGTASISKKARYLNIPDLEKLHADCKEWLSELAFWNEELVFLKSIPHKYIEKLSEEDDIIDLRFLMGQLNGELKPEIDSLKEKVDDLQSMLVALIQNSFVIDEQKCRQEHKSLATRMENCRDLYEDTRTALRTLVKKAFRKPKK